MSSFNNSISNSRLTLSLPPSIDSYTPGSILRPIVTLHCSTTEFNFLTLHLIGTTQCIIMGKDRFQAGGSPILITSIERLPFLDIEVPLISISTASSSVQVSEKKFNLSSSSSSKEIPKGGIYKVQLPNFLPGILPTSIKSVDDAAGVSVRYYLELRGGRKGLLKSNDKLQLDFKVVIPLIEPDRILNLAKHWDSNSHTVNLKYKNDNTSNPLRLFAKFSVKPVSTSKIPIQFHLHLSSDSLNGLTLLNNSTTTPIITVSLARRVHTNPIKEVGLGKPFDWAGVRMNKGSLEKVQNGGGEKGEGEEWKGEVVIPTGLVTVECKGLRIHYVLTCSIRCPSLERELIVKVNVFLPSADHTTSPNTLDYIFPPQFDDEHVVSDLPRYSA